MAPPSRPAASCRGTTWSASDGCVSSAGSNSRMCSRGRVSVCGRGSREPQLLVPTRFELRSCASTSPRDQGRRFDRRRPLRPERPESGRSADRSAAAQSRFLRESRRGVAALLRCAVIRRHRRRRRRVAAPSRTTPTRPATWPTSARGSLTRPVCRRGQPVPCDGVRGRISQSLIRGDRIPWDSYDRIAFIHAGSDHQSDLANDSPGVTSRRSRSAWPATTR